MAGMFDRAIRGQARIAEDKAENQEGSSGPVVEWPEAVSRWLLTANGYLLPANSPACVWAILMLAAVTQFRSASLP